MVTLYNVVSSDWYIADENGLEDFIPDELWPITLEVLKRFDLLVMGRKTYEAIQQYPSALLMAFEALPLKKIVVSRGAQTELKAGYSLNQSIEDTLNLSANVLVSTGKSLNNYLLHNHLVDRVMLHQLPQALGKGLAIFDSEYRNALILDSESDVGVAKEIVYRVDKS